MFIALFVHSKTDVDNFLNNTKFIELLQNFTYSLNIYYTDNTKFVEFINLFNTFELPFNNIYYDTLQNNKNNSIKHFIQSNENIYFNLDTNVMLKSYSFLKNSHKTSILAPLVKNYNELFSNFWGEVDENGFYKRSNDYLSIVNRLNTGIFTAKYINSCFVIHRSLVESIENFYKLNYKEAWDYDVTFAYNCRQNNIPMKVINEENYGYYNHKITLFDYFDHKDDWKKKYFHKDFLNFLSTNNFDYRELCQDAFQFPLFSEVFCKELIDITVTANLWSAGKNNDNRLTGGYENHPTVDVHLNQIALHDIWNDIVKNFISKAAAKLYSDITTKGTNINFVVKYTMGGQEFLRPHHDASMYTVNIALNLQDRDYIGGGCRFIRQNYSITNTPVGYCNIHPGRLTHYHEGLPITSGTRFILVSFIE